VKKIMVVTGSRSEYGLLKPVMRAIKSHPQLSLQAVVTGMHLLPEHGLTYKQIESDGFEIDCFIPMYENHGDNDHAQAFAQATGAFSQVYKEEESRPDILVVLGDRLEILAAVIPAFIQGIPIAHIHGGDTSQCGLIDDSIRHAVSKFSHIHFVASSESAERLLRMGEEDFRIFQVGSPAVDAVQQTDLLTRGDLFDCLNLGHDKPLVVCLQHSVAHEAIEANQQMTNILAALETLDVNSVVIYPNNDSGSQQVIAAIKNVESLEKFKIFKSLPSQIYYSLLKHAACMVGNSSSGVIETPIFGLPSISVGTRQIGRQHAENVIFVDSNKQSIVSALNQALFDVDFRLQCQTARNPYGDGHTAARIAETLATINLKPEFLVKKLTY